MAKEAAVSGGIKGILKRRETDMTSGNIWKHLISFALPLMVGSIFQQLYNTVDTWVVGNYVSNEAFSAVGSVGPIINMLIGFFTGLATGAGVVISQFFGARQEKEVSRTVHTAIALAISGGAALTVLGTGALYLFYLNAGFGVWASAGLAFVGMALIPANAVQDSASDVIPLSMRLKRDFVCIRISPFHYWIIT